MRAMVPGQRPPSALTRVEVSSIHALRDVPIDAVWSLLERCPVRGLEPGQILLHQGQANDRMHFVLEGMLSVKLAGAESESIALLSVGDAVGELSVIDKKPAARLVIAETSARLLTIDEGSFWQLVEASHAFSKNMLLVMASRVRSGNAWLGAHIAAKEKLEQDAMVDALTGVYNRRWIDDRLARLLLRAHRDGRQLSLLMLDIDHFKRFNDVYGHPAGDAVLVAAARTIAGCMRPTDLVARYGGEEFVVALPTTNLAGACVAAERLRRTVSAVEVRSTDGSILPTVTVSIGVVESDAESEIGLLLARADKLLYEAKRNGRNRVEWR
jgi:diguanylate cyclase (GGDEF)-like protein